MSSYPIIVTLDPDETEGGQFFIRALTDRHEEKYFLDTGATSTTVKANSFFAGYKSVRDAQFVGLSGKPSVASKIQVGDISVGEKSFGAREIVRLPDEPGIMTTMGIDLFQGLKIGFDLKNKKLNFNPECQTRFPFDLSQRGHILVPVSFGDSTVQMIWDTGAGLTTLDEKFIDAHPTRFRFLRTLSVGDTVAKETSKMKLYEAQDLILAGIRFSSTKVLATDFSVIQQKLKAPFILGAAGFNVLKKYNWCFDLKTKTYSVE